MDHTCKWCEYLTVCRKYDPSTKSEKKYFRCEDTYEVISDNLIDDLGCQNWKKKK